MLDRGPIAIADRIEQLDPLLIEFRQHTVEVGPVETDPRGTLVEFVGARQRRQGECDAVEQVPQHAQDPADGAALLLGDGDLGGLDHHGVGAVGHGAQVDQDGGGRGPAGRVSRCAGTTHVPPPSTQADRSEARMALASWTVPGRAIRLARRS